MIVGDVTRCKVFFLLLCSCAAETCSPAQHARLMIPITPVLSLLQQQIHGSSHGVRCRFRCCMALAAAATAACCWCLHGWLWVVHGLIKQAQREVTQHGALPQLHQHTPLSALVLRQVTELQDSQQEGRGKSTAVQFRVACMWRHTL